MNNEIRCSVRKVCAIGCATFLLFLYTLNRNSCEDSNLDKKFTEESALSPIIYCVTPTYKRSVQKAELTR